MPGRPPPPWAAYWAWAPPGAPAGAPPGPAGAAPVAGAPATGALPESLAIASRASVPESGFAAGAAAGGALGTAVIGAAAGGASTTGAAGASAATDAPASVATGASSPLPPQPELARPNPAAVRADHHAFDVFIAFPLEWPCVRDSSRPAAGRLVATCWIGIGTTGWVEAGQEPRGPSQATAPRPGGDRDRPGINPNYDASRGPEKGANARWSCGSDCNGPTSRRPTRPGRPPAAGLFRPAPPSIVAVVSPIPDLPLESCADARLEDHPAGR